ncbi:MAG TPA: barstar family protein [Burkholderiales bacterium]|nr:barstar family protein [Burkholderiales bacterium]
MSKLFERLQDPVRSGVYRVTRSDAVDEVMPDAARIDLKDGNALRAIAKALHFPDWFGGNWDALEDCLGDLSWRSDNGHVLVFLNWQALSSDDLGLLIDILRSSAESWQGRGKPFFAVLLDPQGRLALPPLYRES